MRDVWAVRLVESKYIQCQAYQMVIAQVRSRVGQDRSRVMQSSIQQILLERRKEKKRFRFN